jgi:hypothetical protein
MENFLRRGKIAIYTFHSFISIYFISILFASVGFRFALPNLRTTTIHYSLFTIHYSLSSASSEVLGFASLYPTYELLRTTNTILFSDSDRLAADKLKLFYFRIAIGWQRIS